MINIDERVEKARKLFKDGGYNCCQAVVLAYNDVFGIDDDTAAALASGFGGGFGRMREVCGSVSGMVLLAGLLKPACDPSDKVARTANYALVQEVAGEFKTMNGSIVCRELLGLPSGGGHQGGGTHDTGIQGDGVPGSGIHGIPESPVPSDRTAEYYKKRPCEELVGISARIIGEKILKLAGKDENNL